MTKLMKCLASLFALCVPTLSHAIELDYYTYNGFEETVSAFQRLALILNDTNFLVVAGVIVMFGIALGAVVTAGKGMAGGGIHPILWTVPIIFGMAVFKGLVLSKGTIHIYDPVRNAYAAVGDVPDLVVGVAGTLNKIERMTIDMVDSSSIRPFADTGGGINYSLLLAMSQSGYQNSYLDRSASRYYKDCGTFAMQAKTGGADEHRFRRGAQDLGTEFGTFINGAIMTEYYPTNGAATQVLSCTDAWTALQAEVNNLANYTDYRQYICRQAGFNPADGAQMARCDTQLSDAATNFGLAPGPNMVPLLRSFALAKAVTNAMKDPDFTTTERTIVNRNMMIQAEGASQASAQWIPRMRTFMTAMAIGLVPLLALLIPTPVAMKALGFTIGFFIFITMWGICDAIAVVMLDEQAAAAFEQVRQYNLGYEAIMNTPTAAVQALGVFAKARYVAMGMAGVLSAGLFAFGGYQFANQAQHLSTEVEKEGERAAMGAATPEGRASTMGSMTSNMAAQEVAMARSGFGTMTADGGQSAMGRMAYREGMISQQLKQSGEGYSGILAESAARAGSDFGAIGAWRNMAGGSMGDISQKAARSSEVSTTYNTERTIAKGDQLDDTIGLSRGAQLDGRMEGARTGVNERLVETVTGSKTPNASGYKEVATQQSASELGTAQAMKNVGGSEAAVDMYQSSATRQEAHMRELRDEKGEHLAGETAGKRELIGARAFDQAESVVGAGAQQASATFGALKDAHGGAAARDYGNMNQSARAVAQADFARSQSQASMLSATAEFLGLDGRRVQDLVHTSQMRDGAGIRVAAEGDTLDSVVTSLVDRGLMQPEYAAKLREQGAATFDVALSSSGAPLSVSARAGSTTDVSNTYNETTGESISERHTQSFDVSRVFEGKMALMQVDNLTKALENVYDTDTGRADDAKFASLATAAADARAQLGKRDVVVDSTDSRTSLTSDASLTVGTPLRGLAGSGAAVTFGSHASLGTGTSINANKDINILRARSELAEAREQAVAKYDDQYGKGAAENHPDKESMNEYLSRQQAKIYLQGFVKDANKPWQD